MTYASSMYTNFHMVFGLVQLFFSNNIFRYNLQILLGGLGCRAYQKVGEEIEVSASSDDLARKTDLTVGAAEIKAADRRNQNQIKGILNSN